jgi:glyoxylase-like metal-dependent hydrolase (beta-lactamase superfamily II)
MSLEGWYRVEEFAPGTYQLTESGRWKIFLFIGDEKALFLDRGVGFGDLRARCEGFTDKPIDHVLTHTHWDHIGSAQRWDTVGVHPLGSDQLTDDHVTRCTEVISKWADGLPFPPEFEPEGYKIKPGKACRKVKEIDVLNLGGRSLRIWGHTGILALLHLAARRQGRRSHHRRSRQTAPTAQPLDPLSRALGLQALAP